MKINDLIRRLQKIRDEHGDFVQVYMMGGGVLPEPRLEQYFQLEPGKVSHVIITSVEQLRRQAQVAAYESIPKKKK